MTRRAQLVPLLMLGLSACTRVGPDYEGIRTGVSQAPATQAPFASATKGPFTDNPVPGEWWRLFDDPQLNEFVIRAFAANKDLEQASANIRRANAAVREAAAQGGILTTASGIVDAARPASGSSMPVSLNYSAGLAVSYDLDLTGRLSRLVEASRDDADAAQAAYDLVRVAVAAGVASAWADACSASYQQDIALRSLEVQRRNLEYTRRLIRGGRATPLDADRLEVTVAQLAARLPALDAARENALFRLAVLMGEPPAAFPATTTCNRPPRVSEAIPVGDGASLIRRRPDIRIAEREVAAATAMIGVATADLYPSIHLGGSAGSSGKVGQAGSGGSWQFSLGPLISWSIPNRTLAHARIDQSDASRDAAIARFDAVVLNALREAETALTVYARELQRNASLREARDSASAAAEKSRRLFVAGRENAFAKLDSERELVATEAALAASDAQLAQDQIAVFLALGGGWTNTEL